MKYMAFILFMFVSMLIGFYAGAKWPGTLLPAKNAYERPDNLDKEKASAAVMQKNTSGKSAPASAEIPKMNRQQLEIFTRQSFLATAEVIKDPENYKALWTKAVREFYDTNGAFFRNSNLTMEQKRRLAELLADQRMGKIEMFAVAFGDPAVQYTLHKEIEATFGAAVNKLLGEENANLYKDFTSNTRAWKAFDLFISQIDNNSPPLELAQKIQLLDMLKGDEKARTVAELENVELSFLNHDQLQYYQAYMNNEKLIMKAKEIERQQRDADKQLERDILSSSVK